MNRIQDAIQDLDDGAAVRVLSAFAQAQLRHGDYTIELSPQIKDALLAEFPVDPEVDRTSSEGDLARQALVVLAEHPEHGEAIAALVSSPPPERMGIIATAALVTAVLVVLQTHVKFERDKQGLLIWKIEKRPTSEKLLRPLVQKLLGFIGVG